MKVYVSSTREAAGMGGALLAKYAWWKSQRGGIGSFEDMTGGDTLGLQCVAEPTKDLDQIYGKLVGVYSDCEEQVVMRSAWM